MWFCKTPESISFEICILKNGLAVIMYVFLQLPLCCLFMGILLDKPKGLFPQKLANIKEIIPKGDSWPSQYARHFVPFSHCSSCLHDILIPWGDRKHCLIGKPEKKPGFVSLSQTPLTNGVWLKLWKNRPQFWPVCSGVTGTYSPDFLGPCPLPFHLRGNNRLRGPAHSHKVPRIIVYRV